MPIRYRPLPTDLVRALQDGAPDANGQTPERVVSDGGNNPCRHCLRGVPEGRGMLILAHRPFPDAQPYAEQGPIFLCADACEAWSGAGAPPIAAARTRYTMRGYGPDHRIVYGTGEVYGSGCDVVAAEIEAAAEKLLARPDIAYLHLRTARYGCYLARIERA